MNPHDPADVLGEWQPAERGRGGGRGRPRDRRGGAAGGRPRRRPGPRRCRTRRTRCEQRAAEMTEPRRPGGRQAACRRPGRGRARRRHPAVLRAGRAAAGRGDHPGRPGAAADGPARPGRRHRAAHAVELPGRHPAVEGRAEPGVRQRDDPEAVERGGRHRAGAGRDPRRVPARRMCSRWCSAARRRRARWSTTPMSRPSRSPAPCRWPASQPPGRPSRGGRVQAEMGGQNPSVVLADADLDRAATAIAYAAMGYAGQKCTATSRVIVEDAVYPRVPRPAGGGRRGAAGARPGRRQDAGRPRHHRRGRGPRRWPRSPALAAG